MKIIHFVWSAIGCFVAIGCGGADGGIAQGSNATGTAAPQGGASEVSALPASEKTKTETGVVTWEVGASDSGYHGVGRDADGRLLVDFRASNVASCNQNKGTLVPVEAKEGPSEARSVTLGCSADAANRSVDAKTQLMWDRLSSDLGPSKGESKSQLAAPTEGPNCPTQTNTLCCGHVTMWCEDQWTNANFECETSGWYICGTCFSWTPWCS
jgi:hypothetical protein